MPITGNKLITMMQAGAGAVNNFISMNRVALRTTTGNQTITGDTALDADATAAIFILTPATADATFTADAVRSIGFAVGSSDRGNTVGTAKDASASSETKRYGSKLLCCTLLDADTQAVLVSIDFVSFSGSTCTINVTATDGNAYLLHTILIAATNADIGFFNPNTTTGTPTTLTTGFEPNLVLFGCPDQPMDGTVGSGTTYHFGAALADATQYCVYTFALHANPTPQNTIGFPSGRFYISYNGGALTAVKYTLEFVDTVATGFRYQSHNGVGTVDGTDELMYMALQMPGNVGMVSSEIPVSTGDVDVTGFGFDPSAALGFTNGSTVHTVTLAGADSGMMFSMLNAATEISTLAYNAHGIPTSDARSYTEDGASVTYDDDGSGLDAKATGAFITDGLRLSYSLANDPNTKIVWLGFG